MYMLKMCSVSNAFTERINLTKLAVWPADEMLDHPSNTHLQTKMNRFCRTRELLPEGDGPMTTFGCGHGKMHSFCLRIVRSVSQGGQIAFVDYGHLWNHLILPGLWESVMQIINF